MNLTRRLIFPSIILALCACSFACTNPFPFGPGRFEVVLKNVEMSEIPKNEYIPGRGRPAIKIDFSTKTDLVSYFKNWSRNMQVRCEVEGAPDGKSYQGVAIGPFYNGVYIRSLSLYKPDEIPVFTPDEKGFLNYTIFAFPNLDAHDGKRFEGRLTSWGYFYLDDQKFDCLKCYLIGVTLAPALFPKSNYLVIPESKYREIRKKNKKDSE